MGYCENCKSATDEDLENRLVILNAEAVKAARAHIELFSMLGKAQDELSAVKAENERKDTALRSALIALSGARGIDQDDRDDLESVRLEINGALTPEPAKEGGNNG